MLWGGSERLGVYLSSRSVVLLSDETAPHRIDFPVGTNCSVALDQAVRAAQSKRTKKLTLYLGGHYCLPLLIPRLPPGTDKSMRASIAPVLAKQSGGTDRRFQFWIEGAHAQADALAVAVDELALEQLSSSEVVKSKSATIVSIQPWWTSLLNSSLGQTTSPGILAACDDDSSTIFAWSASKSARAVLTSIECMPSVHSEGELAFLMRRRRASASQDDWTGDGGWIQRPEFSQSARSRNIESLVKRIAA